MSENYNYLRELSTPQLEELLRQTLDGNQPDIEYINYILEVIEEREKCNTENHLSNVNQSWKEFQILCTRRNYREKISKYFFDYCCVMHNTNQSQPLKISG